jgi:hypothetical protein
MDAMNGACRASGRLSRLLVCVVALVALSAMAVPSIAAAKTKPPKIRSTYVALGDSLAFGYSQQLFNENEALFENPAGFEHGYASDYLNLVNATMKNSVQLVNDGCPGETTESLIGDNPALLSEINSLVSSKVHEPVTGEPACAYHFADGLPLHNEYGGTKSQLESAIETIKTEKEAGTPVKVVSLDIGANDELHTVAKAEAEAKAAVEAKVAAIVTPIATKEVEEKVTQAATAEVEAFVVEQVEDQAFEETGGAEPAFREKIGQLAGEYSASHAEELQTLGFEDGLHYAIEHKAELAAEGEKIGEELAAKYAAEHGLELLEEGEKIALELITNGLPAEYEQIDTNVIGILAALHHAGFKGRAIFEGTYDPYGRVRGVTKEFGKLVPGENHQTELEPGFNEAAAELIGLEQSTLNKHTTKLNVCYSNAEALFNVALGDETLAAEETEEQNLAEWTNMANFKTFNGKADGPDIHATPVGYQKMAEQIDSTCGF